MNHDNDEKDVDLLALAEPQQPPDPAAQAFAQLRGEVALLRRAVEQLASERADIVLPDYSATLGKIALTLGEIGGDMQQMAQSPALEVAPESLAQRIDAAAQAARRTDHAAQIDARERLDRATTDMRQIIGTVPHPRRAAPPPCLGGRRRAARGDDAMVVHSGMIARSAPSSWNWPEGMAAHMMREPTLWDAGVHLMQAGNPEAWNSITRAAAIARANSDSIVACERKATKARQPVRCTIRIEPMPS
jgi:hypothetical protein